ncbi:MAG: Tol-Pal system beta propeller repeat protein TolB [Natronospirillum sp.]|uniref:Tol-Pal system beta propeller repeat protein TolB n=1 Tax=Natronospirillum sp. TaxID=2812955 RepID=UPI0025ED84FC|nr:Tol-Pal system beta propeller repeat protein TolB [Natronospirillum sp.]MCH8553280.1 Tol-Pal system beta propeller repeat protein TolB [Natronospirillum sp.]
MKKLWLSLTIMLTVALLAGAAQADRTITIIRGYDDPFRISVVPFVWDGSGSEPSEMSTIIENNLERTGQFDALPRSDMRSWPTRSESMVFREWRLLNQDYVVIGRARPLDNGRVEVTYELYDPYAERRMIARTLTGDRSQWRQLAHRASDAIYEEITGVRGVFSTKIAYVAIEDTGSGRRHTLYVSDADGEQEQAVFEADLPIMSPAWSPDASQIAFVTFAPDGSSEVRILTLGDGTVRTAAQRQGAINSAPAFSPDGRRLAYTSSRDGAANIYVMELSSGQVQQITRHWAIDTEPDWVDDDTLIFTSGRSGRAQIYRINLGSDDVERLTFDGRYNARARASVTGDRIVMVHNDGDGYNIATMDLGSRILQVLTGNPQDEAPSLAPNDSMVVYATTQGGTSRLAWVSIDGMVENVMPSRFGNVREPAWSPFTY